MSSHEESEAMFLVITIARGSKDVGNWVLEQRDLKRSWTQILANLRGDIAIKEAA
jgi:hypothetical protein